jgi:molybdenum cofactor synthesis domain-containing protein
VLKTGVLTVSDRSSRGQREDQSGPALAREIQELGWSVERADVVPDEQDSIQARLRTWADQDGLDLILTTGGTGFSPRDITPEATRAVIDRPAPGLAEAMRAASLKITPHAMLSRAEAGIRGNTLLVNLPGSPRAALENFAVIAPVIPHAVELLRDEQSAEAGHRKID